MKGLDEYVTSSGVRVLRVHYSADPAKDPDTPAGMRWLQEELKGRPGGMGSTAWRQEYEIDFTASDGERVWPTFDSKIRPKITYEAVDIEPHWPVYCGFDWGIACPTVLTAHAIESLDRSYQIDEIVMKDTPENPLSIRSFSNECKKRYWWDQVQNIVGDPSIWRRLPKADETSSISIGDMFADEGLHIAKGRNEAGVDMAYISMLNTHLWADLENPKFMIASHCTQTLTCYSRIRKKVIKTLSNNDKAPPEQIISKNVDEFDANKYIHLSLGFTEPDELKAVPGTFEWYTQQLEERGRIEANILR